MWKKAARNSLTIFIGSMLSGLFVFLHRIFVIRSLSVEDYALFALLTTIFAWITVFSHFDLYAAVSKFVSEYTATSRFSEAEIYYHHALVIALVLSCIGIFIGILFSSVHHINTFILLLFFMGIIPFALMNVSDGILKGTNRFLASAGVNALLGLSRLLVFLPLIFVSHHVRLDHTLITFSVALVIPFVAIQILVRRIGFFPLGINLSQDISIYRTLFDYSKWVAMTDLSNTGLLLVSTFILSTYSLADTAVFNVVIVLHMIVQMGFGSITSVLIPQISQTAAQGKQIRSLGFREFMIVAALTLIIVVIIFIFPAKEKILSMILKNNVYSQALNYLLILLLVSPFRLFSMVNKGIVQGLNDTRSMAFVALITFTVNLILIIPFYRNFGLPGVFTAMGAGYIVECAISQCIATRKVNNFHKGLVS